MIKNICDVCGKETEHFNDIYRGHSTRRLFGNDAEMDICPVCYSTAHGILIEEQQAAETRASIRVKLLFVVSPAASDGTGEEKKK